VVARFRGDNARAAALFGEALGLFRELGDKRWIAFSLSDLGDSAQQEGDLARAARLDREGLALFADLGDRFGLALTCERLARVCARLDGHQELALRLFAIADLLRAAIKSPRPPGEENDARYLAELERTLGASAFGAIWAEARALGPEPVIREALATELAPPQAAPASVQRTAGPLSDREREVAVLIAQGLTNRQIGEQLVLSERTVDAHVDHIRAKLKVRGRAQIAVWVTDHGLNRPP
jgi:DNA-binding CsgD family transcriptional regulator